MGEWLLLGSYVAVARFMSDLLFFLLLLFQVIIIYIFFIEVILSYFQKTHIPRRSSWSVRVKKY